jgi:serine/threonine protein phosphatase 1
MAVYAIGDIHGCLDALKTVFKAVAPSSQDLIIFLGDYVDRGPNSRQTIQWVIDHRDKYNFITLKGNHEIMMMRSRVDSEFLDRWKGYGGSETLDSYGASSPLDWSIVPEHHWAFMEDALSIFTHGEFIFVHAGLEPGIALHQQSDQAIYWDKNEHPIAYKDDKKVICGHTARKNGLIADFGHTICIDTYAYGGQWLTCLDVESGKYWQGNQKGDVRKGTL